MINQSVSEILGVMNHFLRHYILGATIQLIEVE